MIAQHIKEWVVVSMKSVVEVGVGVVPIHVASIYLVRAVYPSVFYVLRAAPVYFRTLKYALLRRNLLFCAVFWVKY